MSDGGATSELLGGDGQSSTKSDITVLDNFDVIALPIGQQSRFETSTAVLDRFVFINNENCLAEDRKCKPLRGAEE